MDRAAQNEVKVPKRVLNTLLSALTAGVVPRSGAPYIAIGRQEEIRALSEDLETAKEGGAAVRFLIGRYGSGKSFLIQLMRGYAMDRNFLCADADLSPKTMFIMAVATSIDALAVGISLAMAGLKITCSALPRRSRVFKRPYSWSNISSGFLYSCKISKPAANSPFA